MKKLLVNIQLEMDVPDDWKLIEHPDSIQAVQMSDGTYRYMSFLPMLTKELHAGAEWSSECSDDFTEEVLDMVADEEVVMKWDSN